MELRDDVLAQRKLVADTINEHVSMHVRDARVDHRTLIEQGVKRSPERRMSPVSIKKMSERQKAKHVAARRAAVPAKARGDRTGVNR